MNSSKINIFSCNLQCTTIYLHHHQQHICIDHASFNTEGRMHVPDIKRREFPTARAEIPVFHVLLPIWSWFVLLDVKCQFRCCYRSRGKVKDIIIIHPCDNC